MVRSITKFENPTTLNNQIKLKRYNFIAGGRIEEFNEKIIEGLNIFKEEGMEVNNIYYQRVCELSSLSENLNITSIDEFNRVMAFVDVAFFMIRKGINNLDFECMISGLYGLDNDLNNFKLEKIN